MATANITIDVMNVEKVRTIITELQDQNEELMKERDTLRDRTRQALNMLLDHSTDVFSNAATPQKAQYYATKASLVHYRDELKKQDWWNK